MLTSFFTQKIVHSLDWLAERAHFADKTPEHLRTGIRGEEEAYFYLRKLGYVIIARNYRSPRRRGEIDLIGWEENTLCFIEVKTRNSLQIKPPEADVDRRKRREIRAVAREYLRQTQLSCQWRFDIVSVYCGSSEKCPPRIELFRNASLSA